jgi:hypothetical protein
VSGYRFGDFTPEEMVAMGIAIRERIRWNENRIAAPITLECKQAIEKSTNHLARLYQEVYAAHQQAVIDEENNEEGWWR